MSKTILFATFAVAGFFLVATDAEARCCRNRCCQSSCCAAPACGCSAAPACGASACSACGAGGCSAQGPMAAAPTVADATNTGTSYQSYSYEPNASQNVATQSNMAAAPVPMYYNANNGRVWTEYNNVLRGNRKVVNTPY